MTEKKAVVDVDQTALFQPVNGRPSSTSVDIHFTALFITPEKRSTIETNTKVIVAYSKDTSIGGGGGRWGAK